MKESNRPRWTLDEDQAFVELLDGYVMNDGLTLNQAFAKIAEDLGRPVQGCEFRWQTSIKQNLPEDSELLIRIRKNNPADPLYKC